MRLMRYVLPAVVVLLFAVAGCGGGKNDGSAQAPAGPPTEQTKAMFGQLPGEIGAAANPVTPEKIELGRMLYYDARFSANGTISCNSCHVLDKYGVDGRPTSPGHDGTLGARNSPTVYNAADQVAQFWDGRESSVEAQAKGPVLNPVEHGMKSAADVEAVLKDIPGYAPLFAAAFPGQTDPITFDNFALAIGAFERKLTTYGRWDRWLAGDGTALTAQERSGLDLFVQTGCVTCHAGTYIGGASFQKLGAVEPYATADLGRYDATHSEVDKYLFKVPVLRNVAETGPYMHDGSIADLDEVIRIMARYQLGKTLAPEQVTDIAAFLKALTGRIPADYITRPELPAGKA